MSCSAMATSIVTLKLLIDTKSNRVLFAEAGKDLVDFLFTLMALPLGTVTQLLETHSMVGCLGNLYESIQNLCPTYIEEGKNMDSVLKPTLSINGTLPLLPNFETSSPKLSINSNVSTRQMSLIRRDRLIRGSNSNLRCPSCDRMLSVQMNPCGFVKSVVTYMVMDNLEVTPMSTISSISLLNKFNVQELGSLEERVVEFGMTEALKLLKASLKKKAVLTSIFLGKDA